MRSSVPDRQGLSKTLSNSMLNNNIIPRSELSGEENLRYYEEFKKLYYTAFCIQAQIMQFKKINNDVKTKLQEAESTIESCQNADKNSGEEKASRQKPKRFRRTNQMIERAFKCNYSKCDKAYASEGSLQQHIRLKHEDSPPIYYANRPTKRQIKQKHPVEHQQSSSCNQQLEDQQSKEIQVKKQEDY